MSLTPFQEKCCAALQKAPNGILSTTYLAAATKSNRVAVTSAMRALARKGMAGSFPSDDSQWAVQMWYLKKPNVQATPQVE